jgi:acyl-CoA thioester hydrolase
LGPADGPTYGRPMLRTTHTSAVTEDQIDHLGHMNVMYYGVNAIAGTRAVLADLPGWDDGLLVFDTYTRHHHEQLLGTSLAVRSAVLTADATAVRIHHELRNADTDELAATFVHGAHPVDADGVRRPVPDAAIAAAAAVAAPLPDYAAPRSVSLDADLLASSPSLETLLARGLEFRLPRTVGPHECDAQGRYRVEMAPALTWAGEQVEGDEPDHLHETSDGKLMGWASMETRAVFGELPTVGTRIQSFAAGVAIHDKVIHRVNWAYDLDRGALLTAFESISLAFDVRSRRPMSIPGGYRARTEASIHPDLAPRASV